MAQYVKATNFASKDALLSGDPNKIVKGAEIDDEFSAIQTAVNSKADTLSPTLTGTPLAPTATAGTVSTQVATTAFVGTAVTNGVAAGKISPAFTGTPTAPTAAVGTNTTQLATTAFVNAEIANDIAAPLALKAPLASPALTGTPTAPTAAFGTNTTQIATTAFVQAALQAVYPVGSIYIGTTATNPGTIFGFGTWVAFGAGKVLVGQDTGDTSFDTLGETGGSKDAIVVSHNHSLTDPGHRHNTTLDGAVGTSATFQSQIGQTEYSTVNGGYESAFARGVPDSTQANASTSSTSTTGISIATTGSSGTNANLQPYVVVKMWQRTA